MDEENTNMDEGGTYNLEVNKKNVHDLFEEFASDQRLLGISICSGTHVYCDKCKKQYFDADSMERHRSFRHPNSWYQCKKCQKYYTNACGIRDHKCESRGDVLRDQRPEDKDENRRNKYFPNIKRKKNFRCAKCSHRFVSQPDLKKHHEEKHKESSQACEQCGKTFSTKGNLTKHVLVKHTSHRNRCEECGKTFAYEYDLEKHLSIHDGNKPFRCPVKSCGRSYTTRQAANAHREVHRKKVLKCVDCGFETNRYRYLVQHVEGAHGEGYQCPKCLRKCKWRTSHKCLHKN
jgi:hypothetical protein